MDEGWEGGASKGEPEAKHPGDGPGDQNSQEEGAPGRLAPLQLWRGEASPTSPRLPALKLEPGF